MNRKPLITTPYRYSILTAIKVAKSVLSGKLTHDTGTKIMRLEKEFADYHRCHFALATNSGTSALELAIQALNLQPGDEVIVPAYTFVASAQAILTNNAIPIFADIDETFTISPVSVSRLITPKTKAIMVVHMFGNVANLEEILKIAASHKLWVIEDCAQAIGATWKQKPVGTVGDLGCFSFNEKKALPAGQGGMLITHNKELYRRALIARNTGIDPQDGLVKSFGHTYYMTEVQATLARDALLELTKLNSLRKRNFMLIKQKFMGLAKIISFYHVLPSANPSYSRLVFLVDFSKMKTTREQFIAAANELGIPLKTFYPTPLYKYPLFRQKKDLLTKQQFPFNLNKHLVYPSKLPLTELFCRQQVGMEFSPYLSANDMNYLVDQLKHLLITRR